jgi:hypothetical protein
MPFTSCTGELRLVGTFHLLLLQYTALKSRSGGAPLRWRSGMRQSGPPSARSQSHDPPSIPTHQPEPRQSGSGRESCNMSVTARIEGARKTYYWVAPLFTEPSMPSFLFQLQGLIPFPSEKSSPSSTYFQSSPLSQLVKSQLKRQFLRSSPSQPPITQRYD